MVPRTCMQPLTHGAARGRTLRRLSLCCRASPMVPLSSTCGRASVLRCRAVLHIAAHCRMWPRSATCCRAPMVPRAEVRFIVYVWPRTYTRCRAVLRHFVRYGFVYVIVCHGAAHCQCFRAPLFSWVVSVYGAAH